MFVLNEWVYIIFFILRSKSSSGMYEIIFPFFLKVWVDLLRSFLYEPVPGDMLSGFKKAYWP